MDFEQRVSPRVRKVLRRLAAANRPADAVLGEVAPGFPVGVGGDRDDATVLDIVRERAEAVTTLLVDPTGCPAVGSGPRRRAFAYGEFVGGPPRRA